MDDDSKTTNLSNVIQIDDDRIQDHLGRVVRSTVEETLNALLDAEADALAGAGRYERSEGRRDYRAGHRERKLHTKAGEVTLKVPKLRKQAFETAIIERYRRREASVEEALMEMYLAGVSVRRVEDITEALWGTRVSARNYLASPCHVDLRYAPIAATGRSNRPNSLIMAGPPKSGRSTGCSRSSAWIWLFSSTHSTSARLGDER